MALNRRLMQPRVGEEVIIYQNGQLLAEGLVTHADDHEIHILGSTAETRALALRELLLGIDDRSIVVKKKTRLQ